MIGFLGKSNMQMRLWAWSKQGQPLSPLVQSVGTHGPVRIKGTIRRIGASLLPEFQVLEVLILTHVLVFRGMCGYSNKKQVSLADLRMFLWPLNIEEKHLKNFCSAAFLYSENPVVGLLFIDSFVGFTEWTWKDLSFTPLHMFSFLQSVANILYSYNLNFIPLVL